jgi:hypothetical protein
VKDFDLMNQLITFFGCGTVNVKDTRCDFSCQSSKLILKHILLHFDHFPLCNIKSLDFTDFKQILKWVEHKQEKEHWLDLITLVGRMNSKRN